MENGANVNVTLDTSQFTREKEYWLKQLDGEWEKSSFPSNTAPGDRTHRTGSTGASFETVEFRVTGELFRMVQKISGGSDPRLHMVLLTVVLTLLHKYTAAGDLIVGAPIYRQDIQGRFSNTVLVLRNRVAPQDTFKDVLLKVKDTIFAAVEHQSYPLEQLAGNLGFPLSEYADRFFDVAVFLENIHDKTYLEPVNTNLTFGFTRLEQEITCRVEYNKAVYSGAFVDRLAGHYEHVLGQALRGLDTPLRLLEVVTDEEKKQLLTDFNDTAAPFPEAQTIHRLFEEQVLKTPGNPAAIRRDGDGPESAPPVVYDYGELNRKSNRLAHLLREKGVSTGSVTAVMMEPSPDRVVALMAVLKAGGAYLPIDTGLPEARVRYMLEDSGARMVLIDGDGDIDITFTALRGTRDREDVEVKVTAPRPHIEEFNTLSMPDRSLIRLDNYKNKIGMASVTNSITIQSTRGCPYECLFCHRIWSKKHVHRDAESIFQEILYYHKQGVVNFAFIDDCFNLDKVNSSKVFQQILRHKLDIQLFFPNGLRGDIMTPDYIDLMVEAGTRGINLSLESASPRLQKLLRKHLKLDKFKEVLDYISGKHPGVMLELASMHGFPTETEEEAKMTLDFIKSIRWLHFPYIHILKIFPNTEMEEFALENGVSKEDILKSRDLAFHELPETLPFPKSFTRKYQSDFMNNYFLDKERLSKVLPVQMDILSHEALTQKYNAYLPTPISRIGDICDFAGLENLEVPAGYEEKQETAPVVFTQTMTPPEPEPGARRILFLDLSQHFSSHHMLYNVAEQPLGQIYLLTYLKERLGGKIDGRILKSGNDFDSYGELREFVLDYKPHLIGIRTLTFFKEFFHQTAALLRQWGVTVPIITGGPYASSDYDTLLKDENVDLAIMGEGEHTLMELIGAMPGDDFTIPGPEVLSGIRGLAYAQPAEPGKKAADSSRQVLVTGGSFLNPDADPSPGTEENLSLPLDGRDLAYVMYTSGSTGRPKGVMIEHRQVLNCTTWMQDKFRLTGKDVVLQRTPLTFDPSVWELFWPLHIGGATRVLGTYQAKDIDYLLRLMEKDPELTMMYCPATLVTAMVTVLESREEKPGLTLPWFLIGAEPIARDVVNRFFTYYRGRMVNTYGPTEATINNTYHDMSPNDPHPRVPIGEPVANNRVNILSRDNRLAPIGVSGEIVISGDSLARGYVNNVEKTAAAFIGDPLEPGGILYRTGDIGRRREDGCIEIMGRVDEQVKIRGYRIEPGEIQNVMNRHPAVEECLVTVRGGEESNQAPQTCKTCGITTDFPNITLDDDGVCNICILFNRHREDIDQYFKSPSHLRELITASQNAKTGAYDCLLLYAGGRGAAYALYQLAGMGFKVLTATYDNGYFSKADRENIKKITASLGVDHMFLRHPNSDQILGESIGMASTVCRGCFHASSSLAGQLAYEKGIPLVVGATLSRGQIIENKLLMFLQQQITGQKELEQEIARMQRSAPQIDKAIFDHIDIDIITGGGVHDRVKFVDFYRYFDISNSGMIDYLNGKSPYWENRPDYAVYSTNCAIKQIGDYGHLRERGFHYYGGATSWEVRLGHLAPAAIKDDLHCRITEKGYEKFLSRVGRKSAAKSKDDDKYLCAYVVLSKDADQDRWDSDLKTFLSGKVPEYMVPAYFTALESIPLAPSGKVDKKALPEPERNRSRDKADYVPPETDMEIVVAETWKEILKLDRVGTRDNFFDLGGNSLNIVMAGSKLKAELKRDIPAVTLFTYPTVQTLAEHLGREADTAEKDSADRADRVQSMQEGRGRLLSRRRRK